SFVGLIHFAHVLIHLRAYTLACCKKVLNYVYLSFYILIGDCVTLLIYKLKRLHMVAGVGSYYGKLFRFLHKPECIGNKRCSKRNKKYYQENGRLVLLHIGRKVKQPLLS